MPNPTRTHSITAAAGELKAHRGSADFGEDRAQLLPQELPHALAVLMRSMFDHPELFFLYTAGPPSSAAAFDASNLDSGHHRPEHRHW